MDIYQDDAIKKIVQEYCLEKEKVLSVVDEGHKEKVFNKKI